MPKLTIQILKREAHKFSQMESSHKEKSLFGVTDGKAVGTYLEHKFRNYLRTKYSFQIGSSASGIDFPELQVDMKVTSIAQPQSSCPFKSARQKIYGLGYSLLIFVYDKTDNTKAKTTTQNILHTIFVGADRTADYQMTIGLTDIMAHSGNKHDLKAFMFDKNLPILDEDEADKLADQVMSNPPKIGYLTISNALQWRLQYSRVIEHAGLGNGISLVYRAK